MMPLAMAHGKVRIVNVHCGMGCRQKLVSLGLMPGMGVRVVSNTGGPVVLDIKGARVAIGKGLAMRIYVMPYSEG